MICTHIFGNEIVKDNRYQYNDNGRIIIPSKEVINLLPEDGGELWNRLIFSNSPYLLQHAANPVDWYPWGEEAFEAAKRLNKPIFLSIGYTTCHWCHVMEHESFEDPQVAELMNNTFINIKVDREERPDIDNIYMEVTQMINNRGGWPMTIIMTPNEKPFFAGTYFPKNSRGNRPGMVELIPTINDLWVNKQDSLLNSADNITNQLVNRNLSRNKKVDIKYSQILKSAFNIFSRNFDEEYGGFSGSRNKFPKSHDYSYLIRYFIRNKDDRSLQIINKSLYAMKLGGMYDQIGFGFHRYSTDKRWLVPHFEKMLYDQAMLIHTYLDAYIITKDEFYLETVNEICTYVIRELLSDTGGFYSAEDADSQGEEGTFYIWDYNEFSNILSNEELELLSQILNIKENGNARVEGEMTNIPHFTKTWDELSSLINIPIDDLKAEYTNIRNKIFIYREDRVHPQKDDKILTDWNGLMISAFARAGSILNNDEYIHIAENSANFILENLISEDGGLNKSYKEENSNIPGMIEDYSFFIWGLIELYQSTFNQKYILKASELSDYQIKYFWDTSNDGFFFTSSIAEELLVRNKEAYDGAIPSGNSVSAYNFIRLARILSREDYENIAYKIVNAFSSNLKRYSSGYTVMLHAVDFMEGPSYEIIIVGKEEESKKIVNILSNSKQLNKVLIYKDSKRSLDKEFLYLENYNESENGDPLIYLCKNYVCNLPTTDISKVVEELEK